MKTLRVLSIGAGAIGTYIGGSLALQGHELVFIERLEVVRVLKSQGLRITIGEAGVQKGEQPSSSNLQPNDFAIVNSIEEALNLGNYDIALFALKSYDTPIFISNLQSSISNLQSLPPFLCLSNGVANEPALTDVLGSDKVVAGTVTSAVGRRGVGDIVLERLRGVGVAATHPISERLSVAMNEAGLNARLFTKAQDMKWSKMLTNLIANASSAILDMLPAEIFANPDLYHLEIEQLRETLAVMRAKGFKVVDLPGTPVRLLAFAVRTLPLAISRPFLTKAVGGGRGGKMPSFHIDLHSGRGKSEVDYLNGAVVRASKEMCIPTPVNQVLTETLLALTYGKSEIAQFARQPERLLERL
jgi:2-dehydropantoate 2-reductase